MSKFFKDYKKLHVPVGRVQFVVFEKFTSAYLFQIVREKSFDYLLIIYKWQFLSRFSILRDKWRQQARSTLLDENLTCEFKRENSFTLSKSCMKTKQFLFTVKSSLYLQLNWKNFTTKQRKNHCGYDAAFLRNVFRLVEKLSARNYWTWYKLHWAKYRETKLKSAKKRNFIALKDILLTSPGCFLAY